MRVPVSVVVPARNEQLTIAELLDSLLRQTWPPLEIIVVDAGSLDRTGQIVRGYSACAVPVRLVTLGAAFPGTARNAGVAAAVSEYIAFTDAGIQLDRHWLERLCAALDLVRFASAQPDVVFGSYEPVTSTFFGQCAATAYVPEKSSEKDKEIRGPVIASCLMSKSVFDAAGGFPPHRAAEDLMFLEKIQKQQSSIAYAPDAIAYWEMAAGWWSTYRRFTLYSYHNLVAGRGRYWHHGVARFYVLSALFLILAGVSHAGWLVVPILGGCVRVAVTIWRKRKEPWGATFNPLRWIVVGLVLLVLDAATFSGAVWWASNRLRGRLPRRTPSEGATSRQRTPA